MTDLQHHIRTRDLLNSSRFCQSMEGVCSYLTAKIVWLYQIFWLYELQLCVRPSVYVCHVCNGFPKLRNATVKLIMPIPLSVCPSTMNNLSRNICGFFENLTIKLIYHCSLITIASALQQTALHLWYHLAEYFL